MDKVLNLDIADAETLKRRAERDDAVGQMMRKVMERPTEKRVRELEVGLPGSTGPIT